MVEFVRVTGADLDDWCEDYLAAVPQDVRFEAMSAPDRPLPFYVPRARTDAQMDAIKMFWVATEHVVLAFGAWQAILILAHFFDRLKTTCATHASRRAAAQPDVTAEGA